jgi:hypothetical protein
MLIAILAIVSILATVVHFRSVSAFVDDCYSMERCDQRACASVESATGSAAAGEPREFGSWDVMCLFMPPPA